MDFIRASIKAVFHDYPLASTLRLINDKKEDEFCKQLVDIIRWEQKSFTASEIAVLVNMIQQNWMVNNQRGKCINNNEIARSFLLLNNYSKEVICSSDSFPILKFEELLRWNELTLYVGEDILVTSYLAEEDSIHQRTRLDFSWPNQIDHNNLDLKALFEKGLTEVHSHLLATGEVFDLNWICLMNDLRLLNCKDAGLFRTPFQMFEVNVWEDFSDLTLRHLAIVAGAIRSSLYKLFFEGMSFPEEEIRRLLTCAIDCEGGIEDVIVDINLLKATSLHSAEGIAYDYTITNLDTAGRDSVYFIHTGERKLLYHFFRRYNEEAADAQRVAPFVYLYLQIKNRYRKEFVHLNPLLGFENFKRYQDRKALYLKNVKKENVMTRYAIQSSVGTSGKNFFETRVTESMISVFEKKNLNKCLYSEEDFQSIPLEECMSFVVHFLKRKPYPPTIEYQTRYGNLRKEMYKGMRKVLDRYKQNGKHDIPMLVGIDAAGAELNCRPELFGHLFRWAKVEGLKNITYHAGEDFYDLIDGLRTIDETILFLNYQRGNRIGHALALGIDAHIYYKRRHWNVIIPKQVLLDNLVWLYYKAKKHDIEIQPATDCFIEKHINRLFVELEYGEDVNRYHYWQSMFLRSDYALGTHGEFYASFDRTKLCMHPDCIDARKNKIVVKLFEMYDSSKEIRTKGDMPDAVVLPKSLEKDIYAIQEAMMYEIENKGISIECNPSSNLRIGPFESYQELPIFRFSDVAEPRRHALSVSVNTDDSGIFGTSLQKEYSLIALSMMKCRTLDGQRIWRNEEVYEYIARIIENGKKQRFSV